MIVHVPVPLHAALPLQPVNVLPLFGVAVSVTAVPLLKFAEHVLPQLIPDGTLVTVPVPVPAFVTVNANAVMLNVPVTVSMLDGIVNVQVVPEPPHEVGVADHPANVEPLLAVAVSVIAAPTFSVTMQPELPPVVQLTPFPAIVPAPVPAVTASSVLCRVIVPDTVRADEGIVNVHDTAVEPVQGNVNPETALLAHPVNAPVSGFSVNVTDVPAGICALQRFVLPVSQSIWPVFPSQTMKPVPFPRTCTVSVATAGLNVAVTASAAFIEIVQVPVPLHSGLLVQPVNVLPLFGVAVSVTTVPLLKFAEHVLGQRIPDGLLATVPLPVPASVTVSPKVDVAVNVATMVDAELTVTKQLGLLPTQPWPSQFVKALPLPGVSLSVSCVPCAKLAVHVPGQLMPAGLLVTVPVPDPDSSIVTEYVAAAVYVTVTVCAAVITVVHGCVVPKQPPPVQLVKVDPAAGVEYKLIMAPLPKVPEHDPLTPAGDKLQLNPTELVTVPLPVIPVAGWRLKTNCPVPLLNVAVTVVFAVSVNEQVLPVEHPPPLHEPKAEPLPGVSPNVIAVPLGYVSEQVPTVTPEVSLQLRPELPVTLPKAAPLSTTFKVILVVGTKVAVAD